LPLLRVVSTALNQEKLALMVANGPAAAPPRVGLLVKTLNR